MAAAGGKRSNWVYNYSVTLRYFKEYVDKRKYYLEMHETYHNLVQNSCYKFKIYEIKYTIIELRETLLTLYLCNRIHILFTF